MCSFCEKIYPLSKGGLPDENLIAYDETLDHFDIWAATADPYDSGVIEDVKYCPYCGRELRSSTELVHTRKEKHYENHYRRTDEQK